MNSGDISFEEKIQRFLYTYSYFGAYITGHLERHLCKFTTSSLFQYIKEHPQDFLKLLASANQDPLMCKRLSLFYIIAEALTNDSLPEGIKVDIREALFKTLKSDAEFFDFIKYFTLLGPKRKQTFTTSLKKIVVRFYQAKTPLEFARLVTKQESYHSWTHKDLLKLGHFKCENIGCEPVLKYVLFGVEGLPEDPEDDVKATVDFLKKSHELRTTKDLQRAVALIKELQVTVDQVNSIFNKNEEVWLAALPAMTTREILKSLIRFYKLGFFKPGSQFQAKVVELLTNAENIKSCDLHPVEVFIYLKFFEKGGKIMDPKLIEYLQKKEIREETLKKLTDPFEPKCKPVSQSIGKCLNISYNNVKPIGKRFLVTIDVTEQAESFCFHNKRISFLEAAVTIIRFLTKVEKHVTVAVFNEDRIKIVDVSKSHSAIEKLKENESAYIVPAAPIEWARNKKKNIDIFINFMGSNWSAAVPEEVAKKIDKLPDALAKYAKKMKSPDARLVKMYLGGQSTVFSENGKNIFSIAGFSVEVPRILEAFCRGRFC